MKIAVWAWAIDHPGAGMEIIAMDVCSELQKNYEVRLYSQIRNPQYAKPQTTFPIYFLGKNKFRYLSFRSIQAGFRFRKEVIKYHPDVIIFVSPLLYPFLRQFLFGRKLKRIKHIVWEHLNYNSQNKRGHLKTLSRKIAAKKADRLIVLTQRDRDLYLQHCHCKNKPQVIPNFINLNRITSGGNPILTRKKQIVFSGRFAPEKQIDKLLNIWEKVQSQAPEWELVLIGSGTLFDEIQNEIREKKLEKIFLLGYQKDPGKIYAESQILVLTSREEGFGLILAEGLFCDLPLVSFDTDCGPADIIDDGKNGFLIPCYDEELFGRKLLQLMNDDHLREQFSLYAQEKRKQFLPEAVMPLWNRLLQELK